MKLRSVHLVALASAAVLAASALPWPGWLERTELCSFHALTGLPCPGCGLTHAFRSLAHGEFAAAWGCNPFGFPLFALALALLTAPLWPRAAERLARGRRPALVVLVFVCGLLAFGAARAAEVLAHRG
jgi:hypothetical protein